MQVVFEQVEVKNTKLMQAIYAIEDQCFPKAEQDTPELIAGRASQSPECFWIMRSVANQEVLGFLNGVPMEQKDFTEAVFTDIGLYRRQGPWVMLISLDIAPKYQKRQLSKVFIKYVLKELQARRLYKGAVFICKERLVEYYASFGFVDEGISACRHGGASWHQMRMVF